MSAPDQRRGRPGAPRLRPPRPGAPTRSRDAGDTLIELLVTVTIIAIGAVAILGGFAVTVATSGTHRNLTTLDAVVKSFAEQARSAIQLTPPGSGRGPLFARCATSYPLASTPYPSGGPAGTTVTDFVTGLHPGSTLTVRVGGAVATPVPAPQTDASGDATLTFTVPASAATGVQQVLVTDTAGASAATTFSVGGVAPSASEGTPLGAYTLSTGSIRYWNGTTFTSACTSGPDSDLQELQVTASVPGASDALAVVLSNPNFVPTPAVTVKASPATGQVGEALTFTASINPGGVTSTPSGSVTWVIADSTGAAPNCTATTPLTTSAGVTTAGCTVAGAPAGSYTVTAYYSGDGSFNASSGTGTASVSQVAPTVTVAASPSAPTYGSTLTFTGTVTGPAGAPTPTGTLAFTVSGPSGTATCAPASSPLVAGTASCSVTPAVVGSYTATAAYGGDSNYLATGGTSPTLTVPKLVPVPTVVGTPASPVYGNTLTFTATVPPAASAPTPTGTVTWSIATTSGTAPTCPSTALSGGGTATCTVSSATVRAYTATASYGGDGTYTSALATSNTLTVPKITPTITVTASPASPVTGSMLTFTSTVTTPAGDPTATGTVAWSGLTCTTTTPFSASGTTGTATCVVAHATAGAYTATATYSGDANDATVAASNTPVTVARAAPTVTLAATPSAPTYHSTLTFTANVAGSAGAATPTGTATWSLTGPAGTAPSCANSTLDGSGVAVCTVANAVPGTYAATVGYQGDPNYLSAGPITSSVVVAKVNPSVTVAGTPANPAYGSTVTFTATVTPSNGAPTPSGSVAWTVDGNVATCGSSSLVSGSATCTVTGVAPGTYTAVASYGGDSTYATASGTSNTLTVAQLAATLRVSAGPSAPTYGSTLTFTAAAAGPSGDPTPSGTVTWSVATTSGSPPACAASTLSGGTATCTIANATPGTYTVGATYGGDPTYGSGATGSAQLTVTPLAATVTVSAGPASPTYPGNDTLTFTALVSPTNSGGPALSGTLAWSGVTCTATSGPVTQGSTGTFTCTVNGAKPGSYAATATYTDPNYGTSSGGPATLTVPVVSSSVATRASTSGSSVTATAVVSGQTGLATPTGTLTWTVDGNATTCASSTLSGGTATCTFTGAPGKHVVVASYGGDATYAGSSLSATFNATVLKLDGGTPSGNGSNENDTVTATLSLPAGATVAPTGAVSWAVTLSGAAVSCSSTTGLTGSGVTWTATCTIAATNNRRYLVTGTFAGDSTYLPATSPTSTVQG